jgi:hypothetical protein
MKLDEFDVRRENVERLKVVYVERHRENSALAPSCSCTIESEA